MTVLAVAVAAVVAFVLSGAYYAAYGRRLASWSAAYATPRPAALTAVVELGRNLVLAAVLRGLLTGSGLGAALLVALALWVAFPVVLLLGSVYHERTDPRLALVHAGDWFVKLAVMTLAVQLIG